VEEFFEKKIFLILEVRKWIFRQNLNGTIFKGTFQGTVRNTPQFPLYPAKRDSAYCECQNFCAFAHKLYRQLVVIVVVGV
jgi:hypothetical protein